MAYASRAGRARTSERNPRAFAVCDRCGSWWNHDQLGWQFEWAGVALANKRILVCKFCLDRPQPQLRATILSPDPLPILNPRPETAIEAYTDYRATDLGPVASRHGIPIPGGDIRTTQLHDRRVTQQTGVPPGSHNQAPGTDPAFPGPVNVPLNNDDIPLTGPL